ncbi:MAG: glycosyltransferase [Desulfuromonadaceae bacterium]|nr:glycosyltransferase [Desulfuromonadaceae bacterium]
MSFPAVSIIIPCFQQAHFLPDALASVQSQTCADWECLIVDDGSPDSTAAVAKEWTDKDSRFRYLYKHNGGLSSARNFGLDHAKGRYIQFLDADDVILPQKLEQQLQSLSGATTSALSYCNYRYGEEDDVYVPPPDIINKLPVLINEATSVYEIAADWETRLSIPAHCFLFNRIFFDEGIRFDEELPNHEDWDCWMQIFSKTQNVFYSAEELAVYRCHRGSMSSKRLHMQDGFLQAIDKHLRCATHERELKAVLRAKRAEMSNLYRLRLVSRPVYRRVFQSLKNFF